MSVNGSGSERSESSGRFINREDLQGRVEQFLIDRMDDSEFEVKAIRARNLLSWKRFDLAFKLCYLELLGVNDVLARKIYKEDIRSQTLGKFEEPGNSSKNSFETYVSEFRSTFEDVKAHGFDGSRTLIPLSRCGGIINGAHRVASAIYLNKVVSCICLKEPEMVCDYRYFHERNVSSDILDQVATKFVEHADNVYIAFLWPSAKGKDDKVDSIIKNVVYRKDIDLSPKGAFNLIVELYKGMEWVGTEENQFPGAREKLLECFPEFGKTRVYAFQASSLAEVRRLKEQVRDVYGIGFSSIHITDTKEEAVRISRLVFNNNGIHFLNFADPYKYKNFRCALQQLRATVEESGIDMSSIVIDGSSVLSLYGLRKNDDIDYLAVGDRTVKSEMFTIDAHDSELKFHQQTKDNLIYDPEFYFWYSGFKFISFKQLFEMKKRRGEAKDCNDCALMESLIEGDSLKQILNRIRQLLFYMNIKARKRIRENGMQALQKIGLYRVARYCYRKLKGRPV